MTSRRLGNWLGLAYALTVFAFIFLPVAVLVLYSFQGGRLPVPPFDGPSLKWYGQIFADRKLMSALVGSREFAGRRGDIVGGRLRSRLPRSSRAGQAADSRRGIDAIRHNCPSHG